MTRGFTGARHWAHQKRGSRRPDLGKEGNGGSPVDFTMRWWVGNGERFMAELWVKFGGQWRSRERARARRSKLAEESSRRPRFWRAGRGRAKWTRPLCAGDAVEVMHATGADRRGQKWRTDDKCRRCAAAGRPRRRASNRFRQNNGRLIELLWQRFTPKPVRIRGRCS